MGESKDGARESSISDVVEGWQRRLLQLDRRNNLLYFRPGRTATLIVDHTTDALMSRLESSRRGLTFDYAEPRSRPRLPDILQTGGLEGDADDDIEPYVLDGDLRSDCTPLDLQRKLGNLRRRAREWQEEQGLNILSLALGYLHWIDEDGREAEAPLLLLPARLDKASSRDAFVLTQDDEDITSNSTLAVKLSEFGIGLPEFDTDTQTPSGYLEVIKTLIASREGWDVGGAIYLATFSYSKLAMWRDLERVRTEGTDHAIVRALAGDSSLIPETTPDPSVLGIEELHKLDAGKLDDVLDVRDQYTVLPADYSQLIAITGAKSGSNLVIHGPPGTGKSQTIANVIATLIADGKTVLFVSEKSAALDVVKRRLEEKQLDVFCLDMHSERGSKASVYEQLRQSDEDARLVAQLGFDYGTLSNLRDRLNRLVRALHTNRDPPEVTVFQMHGRLADLRDVPHVGFEVPDVGNLTQERLTAIYEIARRIAQREREFHEHWTSRWWVLTSGQPSLGLAETIGADTEAVASAVLQLESETAALAEALGVGAPRHLVQVEALRDLATHLSEAPGVREAWLEPGVSARLRRIAGTEATQQATRSEILARLTRFFGEPLPDWDYRSAIGQLSLLPKERILLRQLLGEAFSERLVASDQAAFDSVERTDMAIEELLEATGELASALGSGVPKTLPAIEDLASTAETIANLTPVPETWLAPGGIGKVRAEIERAQADLENLIQAESRLFSRFEPAILESVDQEMLVRYRTDYQSRIRRLLGARRRDRKLLMSLSLASRNLSLDEELSAVQQAIDISRCRSAWADNETMWVQDLGHRYRGRETEWDAVAQDVRATEGLLQGWTGKPSTLSELLTDQDLAVACRDLATNVKHWVEQTRSRLQDVDPNELAELLSGESVLSRLKDLVKESLPLLRRLRSAISEPVRVAREPLGSLENLVALLEDGARLNEIEREHDQRSLALTADFGARFNGFHTDWADVSNALQWAEDVLSIGDAHRVTDSLRGHCVDPRESLYYREISESVEREISAFSERLVPLEERFDFDAGPWEGWTNAQFKDVKAWASDLAEHADSASEWLIYRSAVADLEGILSDSAVDDIRTATDDAGQVPEIVLRRVTSAWLDYVYSQEPILAEFASADQEEIRSRFKDLDQKLPVAAQSEIRRRAFDRYPNRYATSARTGQLGTLRGELSKRRRQMPTRRLFTRIPELLQTLKPCFLMSPLAVSQFLPISNLASETLSFDMVIFDEASQVFPEDAVPAILRGKQLVLAGDRKQLPPSNFWRRSLADDDDIVDDDEDETESDQFAGRESILDVAVGQVGNLFAESHLNIHYRSRDERLIQFSNRYFYDDRLLTFPSPGAKDAWHGLHDVYVPDGKYDVGASRTNRVEAEKVVDLVFAHMRTRPEHESLGVVALSRSQADLIWRLIYERRPDERDVDKRFSEDVDEPFFVKNLENVQGDERDHMILTIGYGPTASGAVYNRFGPINREGGERRLNVAITRARRRLTIVRSLKPSDIKSEAVGARLLRRFLEYVANPDRAIEGEVRVDTTAEPESPFEEAVGQALERRGYRIARQVGVSGYRVDIAVLSEDGTGIDLGIECDGATYHRAPAARDRDWLREEVLKGLGWSIHRVWSTSWVRNPEGELEAIDRAVVVARSTPSLAMTTQPSKEESRGDDADPQPAVNDTSATETAPEFRIYEEASLDGLSRGPQLQYETQGNLAPMIVRIARIEGPVHVDLAIERIRTYYEMGRVRGNTRRKVILAIERAARESQIKKQGAFIWSSDEQPDQPPRRPGPNANPRNIEHIPTEELESAVLFTVRTMFGGSEEDVVVQTARNLGYRRTGSTINQIIDQTVARMLKRGDLGESFGMVVPNDQ